MKRSIVLFALLLVGALTMVIVAQQGGGQPQARVVEVVKLKDNLFVLTGGGGNTAVLNPDGSLLITGTDAADRVSITSVSENDGQTISLQVRLNGADSP